jgi:hypothetical protein
MFRLFAFGHYWIEIKSMGQEGWRPGSSVPWVQSPVLQKKSLSARHGGAPLWLQLFRRQRQKNLEFKASLGYLKNKIKKKKKRLGHGSSGSVPTPGKCKTLGIILSTPKKSMQLAYSSVIDRKEGRKKGRREGGTWKRAREGRKERSAYQLCFLPASGFKESPLVCGHLQACIRILEHIWYLWQLHLADIWHRSESHHSEKHIAWSICFLGWDS